MVSSSCLFATLFIKHVIAITNIDDQGLWWYDDYQYDANGGFFEDNSDAWYNGYDPDSRLNGTTTCSICIDDGTGLIHGWYEQYPGS